MIFKKQCLRCAKEFFKSNDGSYRQFDGRKFCSRTCSLKSRKGEKRINSSKEKHHQWKGGKIKRNVGYVLLHRPEHPFCQSHGYVLEHRLIMEKHLGRYLHPKEVIHHMNGIKDDNRLENLELIKDQSEHAKHHFKQDPVTGRLIA